MRFCIFLFGFALSSFSASFDGQSDICNLDKTQESLKPAARECYVTFGRAYKNPFPGAQEARVTVQLVQGGQCYSSRWKVDDLLTIVQKDPKSFPLAETVWSRMHQVFFLYINLEPKLGQAFCNDSLDSIVPALQQTLHANEGPTPRGYECCSKRFSSDSVTGERLRYAHVASLPSRWMWSICWASDVANSGVPANNVLRFIVPEAGVMLVGAEAL